MPVIPIFKRLLKIHCYELQVSLGYIVSYGLALTTGRLCLMQTKRETEELLNVTNPPQRYLISIEGTALYSPLSSKTHHVFDSKRT